MADEEVRQSARAVLPAPGPRDRREVLRAPTIPGASRLSRRSNSRTCILLGSEILTHLAVRHAKSEKAVKYVRARKEKW